MTAQATNRYMQTTATQAKTRATTAIRGKLGAVSLAVSGVLFVLYPALRPFSSEKGLDGAAAFGSNHWIEAHMLAMVGFTLLALGVVGWYSACSRPRSESGAFRAMVVTLAAIGLTLPFYGGEAYGLHAIGQEALNRGDGSLVEMSTVVRGGAGLMMFLVGLLLLAAGAILVARVVWTSGEFEQMERHPLRGRLRPLHPAVLRHPAAARGPRSAGGARLRPDRRQHVAPERDGGGSDRLSLYILRAGANRPT